MEIFVVLIVYLVAFFVALLPALRSGKPLVAWPCVALFCMAFTLQALYVVNVSVPSPNAAIFSYLTGIFNLR